MKFNVRLIDSDQGRLVPTYKEIAILIKLEVKNNCKRLALLGTDDNRKRPEWADCTRKRL